MTDVKAKAYRAVLFDMDGVIFDSEQLFLQCWEELNDTYDLPGIREVLIRTIGVTAERTREIFREAYGDEVPYEEAMQAAGKKWREHLVDGKLPLKPGAPELLLALFEAGVPLAIASSTRTELVTRELADVDLKKYFRTIVGGDMVTNSKPAPDVFLKAMESLNMELSPGDCVVIEDSFHGIRAAHAAAMRPVMVPDVQEPTEEIRALAEIVLPDLFALKGYLLG